MPIYAVKVEGLRYEDRPKLRKAIFLIKADNYLEARSTAIERFKKRYGDTIVAIEDLGEVHFSTKDGYGLSVVVDYDPTPTRLALHKYEP